MLYNYTDKMTTYEPDPDVLRWGLHLIDVCGLSNAGSCGSFTRNDPDLSHIEYVREGHCEPVCANVENDELIAHVLQEELSRLAAKEASGVSNVSQDHLQSSILAHEWLGPSKRHGSEHGFDQRAANDYSETKKEGPDDSSGKKNDDADEMGIHSSRWTTYEPDPDVLRWGLHLIDVCGLSNAGTFGSVTHYDPHLSPIEYVREGNCEPECANVENDELIAHVLQEELSRLAAEEASGVSNVSQYHFQASILAQEWLGPSKTRGTEHGFDHRAANDYSETRKEGPDDSSGKKNGDADEMGIHSSRRTSGEKLLSGDEMSSSLDIAHESALDGEVGKRLNQMVSVPVDAKAVADGDTITVYVSTKEPRESSSVPIDVQMAAVQRSNERAEKNYPKADAIHKKIIDSGYRILPQNNEEILAKKYRIRLRGIDAPESSMPYGKEAKEELVKLVQGKCLRVFIYGDDRYGRCVGDVYCNGMFIQELMLKKGLAWHYVAYDQRLEFETWEKEARAKRVGLWASSNPEKPWDWRKDRREGR